MALRAEIVLDAKNIVGESITWDDRNGTLLWVDIIDKKIYSLNPRTGDHRSWTTADIATSIGLGKDGEAIVGLRKSVMHWDFAETFTTLAEIESDWPETRLNEGVVGPDGALWVGTMQNNINPDGSPKEITASVGRLYRVTRDGDVSPLSDDRFGITNTMVWPAPDRLLTADTLENALYSYAYDVDTSRLSDRRVIFSGYPRGLPDGSCIDVEGYVWNCRVAGGSSVVRLDPEGKVDRVAELPCSWPTSCTFGGDRLDILYVTSARFTMNEDHLNAAPWEGALFGIDVGVRGLPANRFG